MNLRRQNALRKSYFYSGGSIKIRNQMLRILGLILFLSPLQLLLAPHSRKGIIVAKFLKFFVGKSFGLAQQGSYIFG